MKLSPRQGRYLFFIINALIGLIGLVVAYVLWQYYQEEGGFYAKYVAVAAVLSGLLALRQWLAKEQPERGGEIAGLFRYGGDAVIRHYSLRWMLTRANILPYPFSDRRLVAFLDAMNDRILLRRVGGGWTFTHRYLLNYFADLT
jgi:hypothetical protein